MPLTGGHLAGDGGHTSDHNLIDAAIAALPGTYVAGFLPEKYGAIGDGTTNDRAALQAAIDAAFAAGGGDVVLGPHNYAVDGWTGAGSLTNALFGLRLKSGVRLRGVAGNTRITALTGPGAGGQGVFIGNDPTDGLSEITVTDIIVDLSAVNAASNAIGIGLGGPYSAPGAARCRVERNEVISGWVGIRLTGGCTYFSVAGNIVHDSHFIGVQVDASTFGHVAQNTVYSTANNGIDLSGDTGSAGQPSCSHVTVTGNVVYSVGGATGIFLETVSHCTVTANAVDTCGYGIYLNRSTSLSQHIAVVGNTVSNCSVVGIQVNATVDDWTAAGNTVLIPATKVGMIVNSGYRGAITGNAFHGADDTTTAHGVQFTNTSSYCTVSGNIFSWLTADIEVLSGSSDIVSVGNLDYGVTTRRGTRIGDDGSDLLGFYGASPVVVPAAPGTTSGFTAGSGTAMNSASTSTGGTGSTAYTFGDVVLALKHLGLITT